MPEYKSFIGADSIHYALVTQDDASAYAAGAPVYMAPTMTITQAHKTNIKTQFADDQAYDVMISNAESELDLEVTGLPLDVMGILLGQVYDSASERLFDNGGIPPDVALSFRSKRTDGTYRYYQFFKGKFSMPAEDHATQADTPDPKPTKLKFTAVPTTYKFELSGAVTDKVKRNISDKDETTWFDSVQVPVAGSPAAFSLSSSVPTDGATGVDVNSNITLTFSNPLAGGAENGIALFDETDAAIAHAISLNAARTVVTINPTAALDAATDFRVVINGVKDVYGQTLADTIRNFTTA